MNLDIYTPTHGHQALVNRNTLRAPERKERRCAEGSGNRGRKTARSTAEADTYKGAIQVGGEDRGWKEQRKVEMYLLSFSSRIAARMFVREAGPWRLLFGEHLLGNTEVASIGSSTAVSVQLL